MQTEPGFANSKPNFLRDPSRKFRVPSGPQRAQLYDASEISVVLIQLAEEQMHQSEPNDSKSFVAMLTEHQTLAGKSDDQMAAETGLANSKIYKLIRQGTIALPIHHIARLAAALNVDANWLLRAYMSAYSPDLLGIMDEVLQPFQLTSTEKRLIEHCRQLSNGRRTAPVIFDGNAVIALVIT